MSSYTQVLALKALDALTLRSEAIAQNIANASSPGYRKVQVSFEASLRAAAAQGIQALGSWRPEVTFAPRYYGEEGARLDLDLADAAATAGRYAALVDVLGRQVHIASLAVTGEG